MRSEAQLAYTREWRKRNPEKVRAKRLAYRNSEAGRAGRARAGRRRYRRNRERVDALKIARGCIDCGYNAHASALQFDHVGDKTFTISTNLQTSWARIEAEIALCEVRCANCHAIKTSERLAAKGYADA